MLRNFFCLPDHTVCSLIGVLSARFPVRKLSPSTGPRVTSLAQRTSGLLRSGTASKLPVAPTGGSFTFGLLRSHESADVDFLVAVWTFHAANINQAVTLFKYIFKIGHYPAAVSSMTTQRWSSVTAP